ncbi:MAG: DUF2905 domain-containing protein [Chloroflexi bacterium]|jgi:hypothetical protein|nr:DUF2905 domain-containing protein [Chloroflexota bacterium]MBT3668853.1 DUF2905 domain-containing protein [Chloroflexota bacterium]MBT4002758.1 DUF2905 domain-containing protein [Chloroflexota bacterium]MBT4306567.1 DUF2905 domain-containing protein [Chloroflexota bacterium]MBT4533951.1 DUF2905 domain-containing protein [Chloroflexota bacterium]
MQTSKIVMILGLSIFVIGGFLYFAERFGLHFGNLPGDIKIVRENFTCAFPIVTSIIISILATIILNLILRGLNK